MKECIYLQSLTRFVGVKSQQWLLTGNTCSAANLLSLSLKHPNYLPDDQHSTEIKPYTYSWLLMIHPNIYTYTTTAEKQRKLKAIYCPSIV